MKFDAHALQGAPLPTLSQGPRSGRFATLSCMTLSFPASRRFIPTLSKTEALPHEGFELNGWRRVPVLMALIGSAGCGLLAQAPAARPAFEAFDVATIKPAAPEPGRFIRMQSAHRFYAKGYTLKLLVGAAYNLNPHAISGGPVWIESDKYDILAGTPGEARPNVDEQMSMLRNLLADRFGLRFHREDKEMAIYALSVARGGSKLKESTGPADGLPELVSVVFPEKEGGFHLQLPARNASMAQFTSMMQRAVVDRPVVDRTGLMGRYDFDLEWTPDETQFGGELASSAAVTKPDLFAAVQLQLGLRLEGTKGPVAAIAIDAVRRPSEN